MNLSITSLLRKKKGTDAVGSRSIWRQQWVYLGDRTFYARSLWEANYGLYLEWLRLRGGIQDWTHEPRTYWFDGIRRGVMSYLPDFEVTENNGRVVLYEVKGWFDPKSKTKLKRMAKYHPNVPIIVIDEKQYYQTRAAVAGLVPGWV
jgi:hypothetical protein